MCFRIICMKHHFPSSALTQYDLSDIEHRHWYLWYRSCAVQWFYVLNMSIRCGYWQNYHHRKIMFCSSQWYDVNHKVQKLQLVTEFRGPQWLSCSDLYCIAKITTIVKANSPQHTYKNNTDDSLNQLMCWVRHLVRKTFALSRQIIELVSHDGCQMWLHILNWK